MKINPNKCHLILCGNKNQLVSHGGHWVSTPLWKTPPPLFCQAPLKSTNCPSPPPPSFSQSPLCIGFSRPPLKVRSFHEPQKYESFSSLIPSYLLKVTKLLGKTSQFEFVIMTEKNIFAYRIFLSLNISDFNLFFMRTMPSPPPWKKSSPLSQQSPSRSWIFVKLPFLKIWLEAQPLSRPCRKGGAHYDLVFDFFLLLCYCLIFGLKTSNTRWLFL